MLSDPARLIATGTVVGFGPEAATAAALYAHATERDVRCIDDLRTLAAADPTVVVIPLERLTFDVLDALYLDREGRAPGVICAPAAELREQAVLRARAASTRDLVGERRIDVDPAAPGGDARTAGVHTLGEAASAAELLAALGADAGVLSLTTHSDGVDARLGPELVMCGLPAPNRGAPARHNLHCANTGHCHRLNRPIAEAVAAGSIVAPDRIACRVLVLTVCYALKDPTDPLDADWNLLTRFLRVPTIGAVVIPPSLYFGPAPPALVARIAAGVPLGDAVGHSNADPRERRLRQYHILFGDPGLRLPHDAAAGPPPPTPQPPVAPPRPARSPVAHLTPAQWGHVELHRRLCLDALPGLDPRGPIPDAASHGVPGRGIAAVIDVLGSDDPAAVEELRAAREALLVSGGVPTTRWLGYATATDVAVAPCPQCALTARRYRFALPVPGPAARRVVVCPRCSFAEDAPETSTLALRWHAGERPAIELSGDRPATAWRATLRMWAQTTHNGVNFAWPEDVDGAMAPRFAPPLALPAGVWSASLAIAHDFEYTVLSTRISLG